jgi:hypothetical protein
MINLALRFHSSSDKAPCSHKKHTQKIVSRVEYFSQYLYSAVQFQWVQDPGIGFIDRQINMHVTIPNCPSEYKHHSQCWFTDVVYFHRLAPMHHMNPLPKFQCKTVKMEAAGSSETLAPI